MTKKILFSFWLLLTMGTITMVFNSCDKDDDNPKKEETNPDDPNNSEAIAVTGISLDKPTLTLAIGEKYTLIAIVVPDNATDQTVTWTSSDESKATVANGKVTAVAMGEATITAKAGDNTDACVVTIFDPLTADAGVIINGVKWATRNVAAPGKFAVSPTDAGMFYQWSRKKAWASTGDVSGWDATTPEGDTWEKANDPSPTGWRVPTLDEIKKLLDTDKITNEWVTENGVTGRKFTDKASGNSLFLPAAGDRFGLDGTLNVAGSYGYYWSSTQYVNGNAYYLSFLRGNADWSSGSRRYGMSLRCVAE